MNSSRVLSLIIVVGLALLVTVPPKLADFTAAEQSLNRHLQQAIVAMLASKGFDIKSSDNVDGGCCRCAARRLPPAAQKSTSPRLQCGCIKAGSKDAQLAFAYRGELSERHPTLRATISEIWSRLRWHLKIDDSWSPVVSVTAKGACAIAALPWAKNRYD